jgi:putative ABC transport system substrate-binding protein
MRAPRIARRVFLAAVAGGALAVPAAAQAPQKVVRIGWISGGSPTAFAGRLDMLRRGMREQGYADERVFIEQRWAEGREELLPQLAAELVRLKPAVIVAVGTPATRAAKDATDTIPIVMVAVGDPVGTGLVSSLSRPGANITGFSNLAADLSAKLLDLLHEVVPGVSRVAVLQNPANPVHGVYWTHVVSAGDRIGVRPVAVEMREPEDVEAAFAVVVRHQAGAVMILPDPQHLIARKRIAELAARHRLPAIYANRDYAEAGGLMSYGPDTSELYHRAAVYVDRILRGARPADLPVEQPTRFELVVNLRAARAVNLAVPSAVLLRADRVIQ